MSNNNLQTNTSSALHNAIMEARGKDRSSMLAPGNYVQWKSRIKRYIDTKRNYELIHYCLTHAPYQYKWRVLCDKIATPGIDGISSPREPVMETYATVLEEIKKQIDAEAEAIQIILTGNDNDIYLYDEEATPRDKKIKKHIDLIFVSFKKIYKPTNNNLRTSSNSKNKNVDNTPRSKKELGMSDRLGSIKRVVNVAGARENVGTQVVLQTGIQCFNYKEFGHVARECKKAKRVRDLAYHKEKMLLCKQEEAVIQFSTEQVDWRDDTDDEPEDRESEAHYMYMAKIQEVILDAVDNYGPIFNTEPLAKIHMDSFLRSKDETPEVLIDFLRLIQRGLQAQVRTVQTNRGTEFLNKTLQRYFSEEGIKHQMSIARTPKQNGVVERRNRTLVEAA
uniref:Integrase, catalytic region, zinc finger, CCHC-type, peptidase aspartic, catalytic n=1 Tax=Tanacetum cinerariifolium TaxID=118510 RepID=A0A6L2NTF2_TANCI|nr:integrase, catalytic region, zinc finger, CCHC-type, peptidase aspartic, catalytic [Tanacetum cinerariifolium]